MDVETAAGDGLGRFTALHRPPAVPTAGVLVCPPLHIEATRTYRREHLLGWELARRGMAVQRFHYRGTGHSAGDPADVDLDALVEDALWAAERLRSRTGVRAVTVLGTRLGALVAARVAASLAGAGLVLWEPALDIDRHLHEVFRARLLREMRHGEVKGSTGAQLIAEMEQAASLDVLGYEITARLRRSFLGVTLDGAVPADPRSILLVQLGRKAALRSDLAAVVDRWRARGHRGDPGDRRSHGLVVRQLRPGPDDRRADLRHGGRLRHRGAPLPRARPGRPVRGLRHPRPLRG